MKTLICLRLFVFIGGQVGTNSRPSCLHSNARSLAVAPVYMHNIAVAAWPDIRHGNPNKQQLSVSCTSGTVSGDSFGLASVIT